MLDATDDMVPGGLFQRAPGWVEFCALGSKITRITSQAIETYGLTQHDTRWLVVVRRAHAPLQPVRSRPPSPAGSLPDQKFSPVTLPVLPELNAIENVHGFSVWNMYCSGAKSSGGSKA